MKRRYLFGTACIVVILGLLNANVAWFLFALVAWHAVLIVLPVAASVLLSLRFGVRDQLVLGVTGLVCSGLFAYFLFWMWLASPLLGLAATIVFLLGCLSIVASLLVGLNRTVIAKANTLGIAGLLWVFYSLFLLAIGLAPFGLDHPLSDVAVRFSHQLPMDNQLPYIFAQQVAAGQLNIPMIGDWLSSDRPPLQAAYFLASGSFLLPQAELHYQVQSTLLQSLWVLGLWLVLRSLELPRLFMFVAVFVSLFSGFALVHGVFTWPKLLPVAYLGAVTAILFHPRKELLSDWRVGVLLGAGCGLAMLSHGGSVFALLGVGLALLVFRRIPSAGFIIVAVTAGLALLGTWNLYQVIFDPPGDRLLKWHLAGVIPIDSRSLIQTLLDSYSELSAEEIISNKLSNFSVLLGNVSEWVTLSFKVLLGLADDGEASTVRTAQFFNFAAALGPLLLAPIALLFSGARKSKQMVASSKLVVISAFTALVWVLMLFGPGYTVIHQGSMLLMCFSVPACILALMSIRPIVGWSVAFVHFALTFMLYLSYMPMNSGVSPDGNYSWLVGLCFVAFGVVVFLLWKLCGDSERALVKT